MRRVIFLSVFSFITVAAFSQTHRIAHRSHSGSNATLIYNSSGNFGLPNDKEKPKTKPLPKKDTLKSKPATDTLKTAPDSLRNEQLIRRELYAVMLAARFFFYL